MNIIYIDANENIQNEVRDFIMEWNNSFDYVIAKTSGSTGTPKEIRIAKSKMKLSAQMTGKFLNLKTNQNALLCLSPSTIAGKMMIIRALEFDLKLLVTSPSSNPLEKMEASIDFIAIVPLQLSSILKNNVEKFKRIKNCIVGGGAISFEQSNELTKHQLTVFQTYGMTETISHVAMRKIGLNSEDYYSAMEGNHFSVNEKNQLIIHTPLLDMIPLETNDVVELRNSTQFYWKGRTDFVINSGGVKLHPEEIESKLSNVISAPFFISSLKDAILGEKVILCIETIKVIQFSKHELMSLVSKYELPKEIYFFEKFEYTESQKINKIKTLSNHLKNAIQQVL